MFTTIHRKIIRYATLVTVVLIASGVPLISIAQAAPVCSPSTIGC